MTRPTIDPANLAAALGKDTGEPQAPDAGKRREPELCGDLDMRIARDGTWFYHGSPIGRKRLTKLFSTVLSRDEDGEFWLTMSRALSEISILSFLFPKNLCLLPGRVKHKSLRPL